MSTTDTESAASVLKSVESTPVTRYHDVAQQYCGCVPEQMVQNHYCQVGVELAAKREARRRAITDVAAWREERDRFREDYQRALGPFAPSNLEVVERGVVETPSVIVRKVLFSAFQDDWVPANIYIPRGISEPAPAIVHACGHSAVGKIGYASRGMTLASAGYVSLSFDLVGMGERQVRGPAGVRYPASTQHNIIGAPITLAGYSLGWFMVQETMAAVSVLQSLSEVDSERIGITGGSGGGWLSVHAAALDERIKVVVPAAAVRSFRHWFRADDAEQNLFDMQRLGLDFPDLLGLMICPRPAFIVANSNDIWPLESTQYAYEEAARFYEMVAERRRIHIKSWDRGHTYASDQVHEAIAWFDQWFKHDGEPVPVPELSEPSDVPEAEDLYVTAGGSLYAHERYPTPRKVFWSNVGGELPSQPDVAGFLAEAEPQTSVSTSMEWAEMSRSDVGPYASVRTIAYTPEPGILLPAEVLEPNAYEGVSILLDESDRRDDLEWQMSHVNSNRLVIRADLRGWGETQPEPDWADWESWTLRFYSGRRWALHGQARMIGRNLVFDRVRDIRALLRVASEIAGEHAANIHVHGRRGAALPALLAALLEPGVAKLTLERFCQSLRDVIECELPLYWSDGYIEGLFQWGVDIPELLDAFSRELDLREPLGAMMEPIKRP